MKNQEWYKNLWHNKMQQLPVEGEEQAMWQKMQTLLDEQMPVNKPSVPGKGGSFSGGGIVLPVIATIIAAAVVMLYLNASKAEKPFNKNHKNLTSAKTDSIRTIKTHFDVDDPTAHKNQEFNASNKASGGSLSVNVDQNRTDAGTETGKSESIGLKSQSQKSGNEAVKKTITSICVKIRNEKKANSALLRNHNGSQQKRGNESLSPPNNKFANNDFKPKDDKKEAQDTSNLLMRYDTSAADISINFRQNEPDFSSKPSGKMQLDMQTNYIVVNGKHVQVSDNKTVGKDHSIKNNFDKGKTGVNKKKSSSGNSAFNLDIKFGVQTRAGSSPYVGIAAGYSFSPRLGLMTGADMLSSRTISGSYNSKTELTYRVDTGKYGIRQSGQIAISGSRKIYTVDVPVTANYRINCLLSVYGGPVISLPVKAGASKPALTKLANLNDTTKSLVAPYVSGTNINNSININVTAGIKLHLNRFFISGSYLQGLRPYTISSGLGNNKINYHTVKLDIGYNLFYAKGKKQFRP